MSFSLKRDEDSRCALAPIPLPSCANRRFCTRQGPKPSPRVQIGASAHRKARNPVPVCSFQMSPVNAKVAKLALY